MIVQEEIHYTEEEVKAIIRQNEELRKKYNSALEKARELMDKGYDVLMPEIFPELQEDKDERIRKTIYGWIYTQPSEFFDNGFSKEEMLAWVEKQGENKPTDKVEPKFKVGNWYQCIKDFFGKGVTFDKNTAYYCAKEGCLQNEYGCHIAIVKDLYDNFKLWTIADAKEGDVLAVNDEVFIYAHKMYSIVDAHCFVDSAGGFYLDGEFGYTEKGNSIHPATKEQRDLLFRQMKEEGYEWDSEKKELKKVEQGNHPRIVMADFTGGEGFYKLNLNNLNKEQVTAIEIMINNPKPGKRIDADKVIEWLKGTIRETKEYLGEYGEYYDTHLTLPYDSVEDLINDFKEDFGL